MINVKRINVVVTLFLGVFLTSVIFMLFVYYGYQHDYGAPYYSGGGSDDWLYEKHSKALSNEFRAFNEEKILSYLGYSFHNSPGYIWFLSNFIFFIDVFFDYHTIYPRVLNCLLLAFASVFLFRSILILNILGEKKAFVASFFGFITPFVLFVNSFIFRDTLIIFLSLFFLLNLCYVYRVRLSLGNLLSLRCLFSCFSIFSVLYLLSFLRLSYAVLFFLIFVLVAFYPFRASIIKKFSFTIALVFLFLGVFLSYDFPVLFFERLFHKISNYNSYVGGMSTGFSSFVFKQSVPVSAIMRVLYSFIYPLPPLSSSVYAFFLILGTMVQIFAVPLSLFCVWKNRKKTEIKPIFIFFCVIYFGAVWGTYTFRHFSMVFVFLPFWVILLFDKRKAFNK